MMKQIVRQLILLGGLGLMAFQPVFAQDSCEVFLGTPGFSPDPASFLDMNINAVGDIYVAFVDEDQDNRLSVMSYSAGSGWGLVGNRGFSDSSLVEAPSLSFDISGNPVVVYSDLSVGFELTAQQFSGGTWSPIGPKGFSPSGGFEPDLAYGEFGSPYVVFADQNQNGRLEVLTDFGGFWSPTTDTTNQPKGPASDFVLEAVPDSGDEVLYIAFKDSISQLNVVKVSTVLFTPWEFVGGANISGGPMTELDFLADETMQTVAYTNPADNNRLSVFGFDSTANAWQRIGSAAVSAAAAGHPSLAWDDNAQQLFVAYVDSSAGNAIAVKSFDGTDWVDVTTPTVTPGNDAAPHLITDNQIAILGFIDGSNQNRLTAQRIIDAEIPMIVLDSSALQLDCTVDSLRLDASGSSGNDLSFSWSTGSTDSAIVVTAPQSITLTISNSAGCSDSIMLEVTQDLTYVADIGANTPVCSGEDLRLTNTNEAIQWQWSGPNGFSSTEQNPVLAAVGTEVSGQYNLVVSSQAGCVASDSVDVLVNLTPTVEGSSSSPVCLGEDLILTANVDSGFSLLWRYPSGNSFSATDTIIPGELVQAGTYTLIGTAGNGCADSVALPVVVLSEEVIASNFLAGGSLCVGDSLRLIEYSGFDSPDLVFSWDFGDGSSSTERDPIKTYTTAGIFEVGLEVALMGSSCPTVTVQKAVEVLNCRQGAAELVQSSLYPVPSSGEVNLELQLPESGPLDIRIVSLDGKTLLHQAETDIQKYEASFTLPGPGMYLVQLTHRYGRTVLKALVSK
ncbi:MAG: PKD domain-containing protein [Bacteroidota bacterium]